MPSDFQLRLATADSRSDSRESRTRPFGGGPTTQQRMSWQDNFASRSWMCVRWRVTLDDALIRSLPKVLLHDHLDGGLRPLTTIELARDQHYTALPTTDAGELAEWFHRGAQRGSVSMYLEGLAHTCGVMQTAEALERSGRHRLQPARSILLADCSVPSDDATVVASIGGAAWRSHVSRRAHSE